MLNFLLRLTLFVFGLVLAASLTVALLLLAAVWGLQYAWARLTGKSVQPWVMRFDPRGGFERFRAAARPAGPTAGETVNARARGESAHAPVAARHDLDVTDVRARPVQSGGPT